MNRRGIAAVYVKNADDCFVRFWVPVLVHEVKDCAGLCAVLPSNPFNHGAAQWCETLCDCISHRNTLRCRTAFDARRDHMFHTGTGDFGNDGTYV